MIQVPEFSLLSPLRDLSLAHANYLLDKNISLNLILYIKVG